ncbi:MAG: hypothetical protein PWP65_1719 [Clostridia bacterium]|nr:hypothetical protein [Clostridia bacterium]
MPRGREIVGLPVIDLEQGEELGRIQDLLCDPHRRLVNSLVLASAKLPYGTRLVKFEQVQTQGADAFAVSSSRLLAGIAPDNLVKWQKIKGTPIFNVQGSEIGTLEDIIVEVPSGKMEAMEVSGGLISDILDGRKTIGIDRVLTWGPDAIIVQEEVN